MLILQRIGVSKDLAGEIEDRKWAWDSGRCASADNGQIPPHDHGDESKSSCNLEVIVCVLDTSGRWVESELIICGGYSEC